MADVQCYIDPNKLFKVLSSDYLELIILPTEQCNFRCTYCYEDFSLGKMSDSVVLGIKKLLSMRAPDLKILKISWFGGEPLAAKDKVIEISQYIVDLNRKYPDVVYKSAMTTNAYQLTPGLLEQLCSLGVTEFQVSLDGPKEAHDKTRLRADGRGSFEKIWENLIAASCTHLDFKMILRIHVTPNNLAYLPTLIQDVNFYFKEDRRFVLFFKAIENLGGPNSDSFKVLHGRDKHIILRDLYALADPKFQIDKVENANPYICYAAQANSFLIRSNGRVGKCTVALSDERNDIGSISPEGYFILDNEKLSPWLRGISQLNLKNLECPMHDFPKDVILAGQRIKVKVETSLLEV